jgi:hypothetical protein
MSFLKNIENITNYLIDEYNETTDKSRKKDLNRRINSNIKYLKKFGKVTQ